MVRRQETDRATAGKGRKRQEKAGKGRKTFEKKRVSGEMETGSA
jgi:hypothetical protein